LTSPLITKQTVIPETDSLLFNMSLFVPVFGPKPDEIYLRLAESGSRPLGGGNMLFQEFQLSVQVSDAQQTTIALSGQVAISLAQQPQPVAFAILGNWNQSTEVVSFTGQMVGKWLHPFNTLWLDITAVSVHLVIQKSAVQLLEFVGAATFTFDSIPLDTSVTISTSNNFHDFVLVTKAQALWHYGQVTQSVVGNSVRPHHFAVGTCCRTQSPKWSPACRDERCERD
jgi:hypothetical protein